MQPHEERIVAEKIELDSKLEKLDTFCFNKNTIFLSLPTEDQTLLIDQFHVMKRYSEILQLRINKFKN